MVRTIKDLLQKKGGYNWNVSQDTTVYDALETMAEKNIGVLLVINDGTLVGIFSERDYARKVILKGKSSKALPVSEIMTRKIYYLTPDNTLDECMALMTAKHIRHLPILESEEIKGILTLGDVVKQIISDQQFKIQELEKYIAGGYGDTL